MDIITWKSHINDLSITDTTKDLIISFFTIYKSDNSLNFIRIKEKHIILALNNINNYKPILLCMDAEFQASISGIKYIKELGALFFIRDRNNMYYYIGYIFINFKSVTEYKIDIINLRPVYTTYSTVTKNTLTKMQENEKDFLLENIIDDKLTEKLFEDPNKFLKQVDKIINELNDNYIFTHIVSEKTKKNIMTSFEYVKKATTYEAVIKEINYIKKLLIKTKFDIYGTHLKSTNLYINFLKSHELYWNDKLVEKRIIKSNKDFFELFSKISENSLFVVKGVQDFIACNNMVNLFKYDEKLNFDNYYDIETFNGLSNHLYLSSQLENTYKNIIKTKIYKQFVKPIFDIISSDIGNKAHNPVVDSLFTIIVAITINVGLNDYFSK